MCLLNSLKREKSYAGLFGRLFFGWVQVHVVLDKQRFNLVILAGGGRSGQCLDKALVDISKRCVCLNLAAFCADFRLARHKVFLLGAVGKDKGAIDDKHGQHKNAGDEGHSAQLAFFFGHG